MMVSSLNLRSKQSFVSLQALSMLKFISLCLLLSSCALGPGNFQSRQAVDLGSREIKRIAIMPSEPAPIGEKTKSSYASGTALNNSLYSATSALPHWQIVSEREVRDILSTLPQVGGSSKVRKVGEMVFADAVIAGRVLRYHERVGEEWGVKSPASVAFVLELWDVKRGDLIWSGEFDETQKALTENLFAIGEFTQRGVRWLSAEELLLEGVKKALGQLHQALYRK